MRTVVNLQNVTYIFTYISLLVTVLVPFAKLSFGLARMFTQITPNSKVLVS